MFLLCSISIGKQNSQPSKRLVRTRRPPLVGQAEARLRSTRRSHPVVWVRGQLVRLVRNYDSAARVSAGNSGSAATYMTSDATGLPNDGKRSSARWDSHNATVRWSDVAAGFQSARSGRSFRDRGYQ